MNEFERAYGDIEEVQEALNGLRGSLEWEILSVEPAKTNKGDTEIVAMLAAEGTDLILHMNGLRGCLKWKGQCYLSTETRSLLLSENERKTDELTWDELGVWLVKNALRVLDSLIHSGFDVMEQAYAVEE